MTKPKHPTWRDWMPDGAPEPEVLSRDELLEALEANGVNLTASGLNYYRQKGVIPRPVHQRYQGKTQAVYPAWMIQAIVHAKKLQAMGKTLEEITASGWMRSHALSTVRWTDPLASPIAEARGAMNALARAYGPHGGMIYVSFVDDDGVTQWSHEWPLGDAAE